MGDPVQPPPGRLTSIDAYRGLVMFLMMAEVLRLPAVAKAFPDIPALDLAAYHQTHVEWAGCSLHDLIQPSFSFLVGVSLPFSLAARRLAGQSTLRMALHAVWRGFLLIAIGTVLRSLNKDQPDYGFIDTLCQIGVGYPLLFLLALRPVRDQWLAVAAILVGYWALFAFWPLPGPGFDWAAVGVTPQWLERHGFAGFAAHWNKNANPGHEFAVWFLNLFPRAEPFRYDGGGYVVLNAVPTLTTMALGLIAGGVLKADRPAWGKVRWLGVAGVVGLAAGYGLGAAGVCPVVKRIWTPSWVLFSGGWCFLLLAAFYGVNDVLSWRRWAFPLVVVGANSIAAYCLSNSFVRPELLRMVERHLPEIPAHPEIAELLYRGLTLLILWLILLWMYRRRLFLKV
jgi:predicted acyltransferase